MKLKDFDGTATSFSEDFENKGLEIPTDNYMTIHIPKELEAAIAFNYFKKVSYNDRKIEQ